MSSDGSREQETEGRKPKRRINGFAVAAIALVIIGALSYRPSVDTVYCDDEVLATDPEVIMLGTWWCPYCAEARRHLVNNQVSYCEHDIENSAEGERLYDQTGASAIPVLIIGKYKLQGFHRESVDEALRRKRAGI